MQKLFSFILLASVLVISSSRIVMTKKEWVTKLKTLANRKTIYSNEWPKNVLYFDGTYWYADCSNLMKALFNGRDIDNQSAGSYQRDLSNTGDVTESGLINLCTSVSSDFSKLKAGEPRILYMPGHIGAYLGETVKRPKGVCNSVESTPAWDGGIQFSYVSSNGGRYSAQGSSLSSQWTKHGLPSKWVQY